MRVGVIGCGFQGRLHVESLRALPDVDLVAVCDLDLARAEAVAHGHGIRAVHTTWQDLVDSDEFDLLTICTMPNTHREIAVAAAECGAHVLCEKPIALNAEDAAAMVAAAKRAGTRLFVGFNMRHMQPAAAVREFVAHGRLGAPVAARGWMLAGDVPWWGRHYVRGLSGGGALAATAVHMLDLIRWLVGSPLPLTASASAATVFPRKRSRGAPPAAFAEYDVEDIMFGHVRFDGGFFLSLEGAWVWDSPGWNYGFELVGDAGQAAFDPLRLVADLDGEPVEVTGEYPVPAMPIGDAFPPSVAQEIAEVVAALRDGGDPAVTATGEEALVVQATVDALYASARVGREQAVHVPSIGLVGEA